MIVALAIALVIVIGVLFLTSHSYIEPLLFLIVLAVSITINMGTNFIFPSVSFITFAVAPILQLALAMDYSIMLLHTFFEIRDTGTDDVTAVKLALSRTFMPVLSSSLTTVAGLVSLMFMSFTIGFDIGIVLSKGILISMITVFLLMPSLILLFARPLRTTMHKPVPLGGTAIGRFAVKCRRVIPVVLLLCTVISCFLQNKVEYTYSNPAYEGKTAILNEVFGSSDQMVILLPGEQTDEEFDRQRELVSRIGELRFGDEPAVLSVSGMVTTAADVIRYYSSEDVSRLLGVSKIAVSFYFGALGFTGDVRGDQLVDTAAEIMTENKQITDLRDTMNFAKRMFISDNYSRLILLVNVPSFTSEGEEFLSELEGLLDEYYPEGETHMAGNLVSRWDISSAFGSDQLTVSLITIFAIFLIVCLSFRSAAIPVLLVCTIQGAVWMNTGISALMGEGVFFMCYLICLAIQMGATIDYGILLTSNYRLCRTSANRERSLCEALRLSMPTILTSGLILLFASGIIGIGKLELFGHTVRVIDVYFIYAIGRMLARGTAFSLGMVLLFLPPALYVCDRFVVDRLPHIDTPNS